MAHLCERHSILLQSVGSIVYPCWELKGRKVWSTVRSCCLRRHNKSRKASTDKTAPLCHCSGSLHGFLEGQVELVYLQQASSCTVTRSCYQAEECQCSEVFGGTPQTCHYPGVLRKAVSLTLLTGITDITSDTSVSSVPEVARDLDHFVPGNFLGWSKAARDCRGAQAQAHM